VTIDRLAETFSPKSGRGRQVDAARRHRAAMAGHYPTLDGCADLTQREENITRVNSHPVKGTLRAVPIFQGGFVSSQVREAIAC
jgi:outer membrane protein TolC